MRATKNRHDCYDCTKGTCSEAIPNCKIESTYISFFDDSGKLIAKMPKVPEYFGSGKYGDRFYIESISKQLIQRIKSYGVDEYDELSGIRFKYKNTIGRINRDNLSEEEKFQIIQRVKNSEVDQYVDMRGKGLGFIFKYKNTIGRINRKDLSEGENFQIIQRVKNSGLDEYEEIDESRFYFKYKNITGCIWNRKLSTEEKIQIIQRVKDSGLDEYNDYWYMLKFKYKGTSFVINYKNPLGSVDKILEKRRKKEVV